MGVNVLDWPLIYKEAHYSPADVAGCTGLSLTLQRDWRSLGHLPPRTSGRAQFGPRELVEVRIMVVLRNLGLGLAQSRSAAVMAAPSVLFIMLADEPKCLVVDAPRERGKRYLEALGYEHHERHLRTLSGAEQGRSLFVLLEGARYALLSDLDAEYLDREAEGASVAKLQVIAAKLAAALPRPMFTLTVPPEFS